MKKNKAQITTFFLVGIVVLVLVGTIIYFINYSTKRQGQKNVRITQQSTVRTQQVTNLVSSCLEKTTKDSLILAGKQAGYIFTSQGGAQYLATVKVFEKDDYFVPYAITVNKDNMIDLNKGENLVNSLSIQNQLEVYINNTIDGCSNFSVLEKQGFDVKKSGKNNEAKISENSIAVILFYPLNVSYTKTKEMAYYADFNVDVIAGLNKLYDIADSMVADNYNNPLKIDLTAYGETGISLSDEDVNPHDVVVDDVTYEVYDQLVMITDLNSQIKGQDYEFWFVKENWLPEP